MTLRLVSDNPDPSGPDYGNIPEMLRQYAAEIEAGQYGEPLSVVMVVERDEDLLILGCGEDPSPYELMGLFEAAKLQAFADHAACD
jgi:hypothetical protein